MNGAKFRKYNGLMNQAFVTLLDVGHQRLTQEQFYQLSTDHAVGP